MSTSANTLHPAHPFRTIATAGLIAGILDGMDAVVFIGWIRGIPVERVFQFIASGALGVRAFQGGVTISLLGVVFHFIVATGAAAGFYAVATILPMVLRKPFVWGLIYGVGVFAFMHYVVVPMSAAPRQPPLALAPLVNLLFSHIFFVGIPIALVTKRFAAGWK